MPGRPIRCARSLVLASLLPALACLSQKPDEEGPRLVLLYAPCTVNCQYLSPYNEDVAYTPNLEAFRRHATVFTKHQTEAGQSGIAFASMFSGTQAMQHGVYSHPTTLPDSPQLITEVYADAGYDVFAWLKHPMANAKLNYAQGVDPANRSDEALRAADAVFQEVLNRLKREPTYRAFIVTNFTVSHRPYRAELLEVFCRDYPAECAARADAEDFAKYRDIFQANHVSLAYDFDDTAESLGLTDADVEKLSQTAETLYKAGIFQLDSQFGELVEEIARRELLSDSLVVFTADHGETFYREGSQFKWSHAYQLTQDVLRVPLIIHAPKAGIEGASHDGVTRSVDLLPTLAGLSRISIADYQGPGIDLSGAASSTELRAPLVAFSHLPVLSDRMTRRAERDGFQALTSLFPRRDPHLIWVSSRNDELSFMLRRSSESEPVISVYDLERDPGETTNVHTLDAPGQRAALRALRRYRRRLIKGYEVWEGREDSLSDEEKMKLLKSLGYIR